MKYNGDTLLHFTLTATPRAGCNCNAYCMHRQEESGLHLCENGTLSPREGYNTQFTGCEQAPGLNTQDTDTQIAWSLHIAC